MVSKYHYNLPPRHGQQVVLEYVLDALKHRAVVGYEKHGTVLMTSDGRDSLRDAFEEALDLCMCLAKEIMEREEKEMEEREKIQEKGLDDDDWKLFIPKKKRQ